MEKEWSRTAGTTSLHKLRTAWQQRSLETGWTLPDDWWTPAVDTVLEAVSKGSGVATACDMLGRARARAAVGIGEALNDLGALFDVLRWEHPPLPMVRALAEGWTEAGLITMTNATCEDPLTGLVTLPYLRSRLGEIYREAEENQTSPADTHRLVVVDVTGSIDPWKRMAQAIEIGYELRSVFRGGQTLTLLGTGRAAALVLAREELRFQLAGLRRLLSYSHEPRVWIEYLPDDLDGAQALLDDLVP